MPRSFIRRFARFAQFPPLPLRTLACPPSRFWMCLRSLDGMAVRHSRPRCCSHTRLLPLSTRAIFQWSVCVVVCLLRTVVLTHSSMLTDTLTVCAAVRCASEWAVRRPQRACTLICDDERRRREDVRCRDHILRAVRAPRHARPRVGEAR